MVHVGVTAWNADPNIMDVTVWAQQGRLDLFQQLAAIRPLKTQEFHQIIHSYQINIYKEEYFHMIDYFKRDIAVMEKQERDFVYLFGSIGSVMHNITAQVHNVIDICRIRVKHERFPERGRPRTAAAASRMPPFVPP